MSVKHSLLALLREGPRYGYELRAEFERCTGEAWPLNVGQVYTTLARLQRDGLVDGAGEDTDGHVFYRLTEAGAREVEGWFGAPVDRAVPDRDELAIKLALAVAVPGVDVRAVVQRQRTATMRALQAHTRARAAADSLAAGLVCDSLVFAAEAELRWLDHCEARLTRAARTSTTAPSNGARS